jgi:phospholipase/carboxylesterase
MSSHTFTLIEAGTPLAEAKRAILLFHGRGGSAADILNLGNTLAPADTYLAALQATNHTWYPYSFMAPAADNQPWLDSALANALQLFEQTEKVLPAAQIYLAGFSQGACLTLETTARLARPFGGAFAFTGGLIGEHLDLSHYNGHFAGMRVFMSNGDRDPHVPLSRSEESKQVLEQMGAVVNLAVYPGRPHTIMQQELALAQEFIFQTQA